MSTALTIRGFCPINMRVTVSPSDDAGTDRLLEITSLALQRNEPVWDVMYLYQLTEEGRKHGTERLRDLNITGPSVTFLKAVDDKTNDIAMHRGKGVAQALVRWGSEQADALRLNAVVESRYILMHVAGFPQIIKPFAARVPRAAQRS
ncbi:hypothetical protein DOTSEDRAFT_76690 [Dothistroma septosporum NZE10]|uniref:Uncharacterized protein n=1 Tax=Dothistroma septosporum (strain NZE10 / CBS 128990) TaxID=675120 RepID=N1Q0Q5_DOTSN|nr:hypothetical protein DOTSEDRAFT_76690 [Dothistroma septosporum NZE10]